MPELPEVETIRRQLEPEVVGGVIDSVGVLDERWTRPEPPQALARRVKGRRIQAVDRRGKYLILRLDGGIALAMHLRMTGNLLLRVPSEDRAQPVADLMETDRLGAPRMYESTPRLRHLRAVIRLDRGRELLFTDARRFGHAIALEAGALEAYLDRRVGIEPLSEQLTAEALGSLAEGRRAPLKSFLLAQEGVAGIGNIYADEALFRAELHPLSPAGRMGPRHWERLREGIVEALEFALAHRGSSIEDYHDARGERGTMQDEFLVHTREGLPCRRCGEEIRRIAVAGRATYFCPGCQRRLRKTRRRAGRPRAARDPAAQTAPR